MASPPNITTITAPRVELIDPRTGLISREWFRFFLNLLTRTQNDEINIEGLLQLPSYADATAQVDTLASSVQALEQTSNTLQSQLATLASDIQGLALAPSNTPQLRQRRYGSFFDTTTQTAAVINTAYAMTFNNTDLSVGVYLGSPTSRVYTDRGGVYNIQFSAQLDLAAGGGDHRVWIWLRVNGTDVPNSASEVRLKGNDAEIVAAWNFLYNFKAGDYFELMWAVEDTDVVLKAVAATPPVPAIPSVILTVTDNISPYQD